MRLFGKFICLLVLVVSGCSYVDKDVSIMSFNIRERGADDSINSWDNRKPLVEWVLNEHEPDIVGIQSIDKNQLVTLVFELTTYRYVGEGSKGEIDPGIFNPIFYKKNKFDLIAKSQFWLSETPEIKGSAGWGTSEVNTVSWVKLRNKASGHIFFVFNTCFNDQSPDARVESSKLLLQKVKNIADNAPVIVTGTFNDRLNGETYEILTGNYKNFYSLWDSELIAEYSPKDSSYTYNGFSDGVREKLDYIFVNGYFNVEEFFFYPVKKGDVFISDHFPIMANLSFNSAMKSKEQKETVLEQPSRRNDLRNNVRIPVNIQR